MVGSAGMMSELHAQMDRAVLDGYGWTDIPTDCEFRFDDEAEDDEGTSKRKKSWRYRWSEEVHEEVLARLLKLNQERHLEEVRGHKTAQKPLLKLPLNQPLALPVPLRPDSPRQRTT